MFVPTWVKESKTTLKNELSQYDLHIGLWPEHTLSVRGNKNSKTSVSRNKRESWKHFQGTTSMKYSQEDLRKNQIIFYKLKI